MKADDTAEGTKELRTPEPPVAVCVMRVAGKTASEPRARETTSTRRGKDANHCGIFIQTRTVSRTHKRFPHVSFQEGSSLRHAAAAHPNRWETVATRELVHTHVSAVTPAVCSCSASFLGSFENAGCEHLWWQEDCCVWSQGGDLEPRGKANRLGVRSSHPSLVPPLNIWTLHLPH